MNRRFVASSSEAEVVTEPSIVRVPLPARIAAAIVIGAPVDPEPDDGVGDGVGEAAEPPSRTMSAAPRSQTR